MHKMCRYRPTTRGWDPQDICEFGCLEPGEETTEGDDCLEVDDPAHFGDRGAVDFDGFNDIGVETTYYFCIHVMKVPN